MISPKRLAVRRAAWSLAWHRVHCTRKSRWGARDALLAGDLLPASRRWLATCAGGGPWESSPLKLAESVLIRIERALYARDRVHEHLLVPQTLQSNDETLFYLDAFLYSLAGAFDAIGRVVHAACGIADSPRRANWRDKRRKENWMEKLAQKCQPIADIMAPEKPHRDALELVFLLRNLVHAEGLSSVATIEAPYRLEVRHDLLLPPDDTPFLVSVLNRLGGLAAWRAEQIDNTRYAIDVRTYVEAILPRTLAAMGAIMDLTPVENLPGASPRPEIELDARAKMAVQRLRLLSGLA